MKPELGNSFCILPWMHLFVSTTGVMRPCCISGGFKTKYEIFNDGVRNYWNGVEMRELRIAMLNGKKPEICQICWDKEAQGDIHSKRLGEYSLWESRIKDRDFSKVISEDGFAPDDIISFDLRLGNLCNLKCIMCNPNSSSKWSEDSVLFNKFENTQFDVKDIEGLKWAQKDDLWSYLKNNLNKIKQIHFAGGEPLLHKKHKQLLSELVDSGLAQDVFIKYNSNITVVPPEIVALWSKFRRVDVWSSIDAVGALNEWIRFPSSWKSIEHNLRLLDETPSNINVRINVTIGALNVEFVPELYDWILNSSFRKIGRSNYFEGLHIAPDLIYVPKHLSVRTLSNKKKNDVSSKIHEHLKKAMNAQYRTQMEYVVDYMNSDSYHETHWDELLRYIKELEMLRGVKCPVHIEQM